MTAEQTYWDKRFADEGELWGKAPSPSAERAARLFAVWEAHSVLVPGCAYGRHCAHFAHHGFHVVGVDNSSVALEMARRIAADEGLAVDYMLGPATKLPLDSGGTDAIYDRALLHLLNAADRERAVAEYFRVLRTDGILYATYFSDQDAECGHGVEVEPGTFDAKHGRPAHFFSEGELREQFAGFHVSVLRLISETEDHGGTTHDHVFWELIAEKEG